MFTAFIVALIAAAALTAGAAAGEVGEHSFKKGMRNTIEQWAKDNNTSFSNDEIEQILGDYGPKNFNLFDFDTWGPGDYEGLNKFLDRYNTALQDLPPMPEMYDSAELQDIYNRAAGEIDAESTAIQQIYDSILNRQTDTYQKELDLSNDAYNAFANQTVANQLQSQNAMQGAYRTELDRAQRNAISRGASAASRLVANINSNLGLQNQSAQQALETSNTLAQALLNQRQAAAGLRQQYSSDLNTNAAQTAELQRGSAERKHSYGTEKQNYAQYLRENDYNIWDRRITDEYGDDPALEGMLRRRASQMTRSSTNSTI